MTHPLPSPSAFRRQRPPTQVRKPNRLLESFQRTLLALGFITIFVPTSFGFQGARTAKIHGQVILSEHGEYPEVMRVSLSTLAGGYLGARTLSADTSFIFNNVKLGSYVITVESPGFRSSSKRVVVSSPSSHYEVFVTIPLGQRLEAEEPDESPPEATGETVDVRNLAVPPAALKEMKRAEREARKGAHARAVKHLNKALEIYPNFFEAYNNLSVLYLQLGKADEAVEALKQSILINPADATSRDNLAQMFLSQANYQGAVEQLDLALVIDPQKSKTLMLLGEAYLGLRECETALDYYLAAIELDPEDHSYLGMGQCYLQLGRVEDALAEFRIFMEKNPSDPRTPQVQALTRQLQN